MSLALGASLLLLLLSGRINIHILENVLFGSVLTVNSQDLTVLTAVALLSVLIATFSTLAGILLPIEFALPLPSGAAIILAAGAVLMLAAVLRGLVPGLKGLPSRNPC